MCLSLPLQDCLWSTNGCVPGSPNSVLVVNQDLHHAMHSQFVTDSNILPK